MYDYLHMFRHLFHNENATCRQKLRQVGISMKQLETTFIIAFKNICKLLREKKNYSRSKELTEWTDIPCSWMGTLDVKITILSNYSIN